MDKGLLWVVVPCFNEAKGIHWTIDALAAQEDRNFRLVFVDNASTDDTAGIIQKCCDNLGLDYRLIKEQQKGTGAAADTGFRYAIKNGAQYIARTDADTSPATNWVKQVKSGFANGLVFMGGTLRLRKDDLTPTPLDHIFVPFMLWVGIAYGKLFYRGGLSSSIHSLWQLATIWQSQQIYMKQLADLNVFRLPTETRTLCWRKSYAL